MARIDPLASNQQDVSIKIAFEKHILEFDTIITNMKATLGYSQVAFEVYMGWYLLYSELKQIVGLRLAYLFAYSVSHAAECPLCTTFFRKIIIEAGEVPENFKVSDSEQKLLVFGCAIALNKGIIQPELFEEVKGLYTTKELVLIIAFAGQMIATNIFNNVIETELDEYLTPYLEEKYK